MKFLDRVKKEMSEGIVRAILEDANYRVIDSGIEKIIRELSCMTAPAYKKLEFPKAIRLLPDFTVMEENQQNKILVDVKYRSEWNFDLLDEVREQVELFEAVTIVVVNSKPPELSAERKIYPSAYIRAIDLKFEDNKYLIKNRSGKNPRKEIKWTEVSNSSRLISSWWGFDSMSEKFSNIKSKDNESGLASAVQALSGIISIN